MCLFTQTWDKHQFCFLHIQGRPGKFESPGQANNLWVFPTIFFTIFRPIPGMAKKFLRRVPKLQIIFWKILSHVETWVNQYYISHHFSDVLVSRATTRLVRPTRPGMHTNKSSMMRIFCHTALTLTWNGIYRVRNRYENGWRILGETFCLQIQDSRNARRLLQNFDNYLRIDMASQPRRITF